MPIPLNAGLAPEPSEPLEVMKPTSFADRAVPLLRFSLNLTTYFSPLVNRIHDFAGLRTISDHE